MENDLLFILHQMRFYSGSVTRVGNLISVFDTRKVPCLFVCQFSDPATVHEHDSSTCMELINFQPGDLEEYQQEKAKSQRSGGRQDGGGR